MPPSWAPWTAELILLVPRYEEIDYDKAISCYHLLRCLFQQLWIWCSAFFSKSFCLERVCTQRIMREMGWDGEDLRITDKWKCRYRLADMEGFLYYYLILRAETGRAWLAYKHLVTSCKGKNLNWRSPNFQHMLLLFFHLRQLNVFRLKNFWKYYLWYLKVKLDLHTST